MRGTVLIKVERTDFMAVALKEDYQRALDEQKKEVRELVMAGMEQIKERKTKDFNTVCDRLEKKYRDEAISILNGYSVKSANRCRKSG